MNERPTLFDVVDELLHPVLPYAGTAGWAGSATSQERESRDLEKGYTLDRQQGVLNILARKGACGAIWGEIGDEMGLHHGAASGVLSVLHKAGYVVRLTERRNKCQVYVLPKYAQGRELAPYKPNVSTRLLKTILEELDQDLAQGSVTLARKRIALTLQQLSNDGTGK
jgi:DNA-binding MarR family transcriptional regulator